ncbi:hypothetical protein RJ640_010413 [Escallonia rubra]|uniref:Uncharacterized protein n=1 Tax=Escallonia rubra TaxID=112253 RepID=A0AA88QUQ2_9ASTE|nr:hypothetical protein RJ640_010413 [Escallonia rubra]
MDRPSGSEEEENGAKKPELDQLKIETRGQDSRPEPDPKVDGGANGEQEADTSKDDKATSSTPNRVKKSVSWSEELVMESTYSRSDDDGSNPYVAYTPAPSNPPPFNFKGKYGIEILNVCLSHTDKH